MILMGINEAKAWARVGSALFEAFGLDLEGAMEFFGLDDWEEKIEQLEDSGLINGAVAQTMQQWGESEPHKRQ
jgi:hypothetical protein